MAEENVDWGDPPKDNNGRPLIWSQDRETRILQALMKGHSREAAALHGGVSYDTFTRWVKGENLGTRPAGLAAFAVLVEEAEHVAEDLAVSTVNTNIRLGDGNLAFKWLERRRPKRYARQDRQEIPLEDCSDEELAKKALQELRSK